jgi:hypothetical protein
MEREGIDGKQWGQGELFASITGYAHFVLMVDEKKGISLREKVFYLKKKYQPIEVIQKNKNKKSELNRKNFRIQSAMGKAPRNNWWEANKKITPVLEKTNKELLEKKKDLKTNNKNSKVSLSKNPTSKIVSSPITPSNADFFSNVMRIFVGLVLFILYLFRKK